MHAQVSHSSRRSLAASASASQRLHSQWRIPHHKSARRHAHSPPCLRPLHLHHPISNLVTATTTTSHASTFTDTRCSRLALPPWPRARPSLGPHLLHQHLYVPQEHEGHFVGPCPIQGGGDSARPKRGRAAQTPKRRDKSFASARAALAPPTQGAGCRHAMNGRKSDARQWPGQPRDTAARQAPATPRAHPTPKTSAWCSLISG